MEKKTADLLVIGAGPGGYVAAIRAAQLGMKVVCVEAGKTLGGTCLNVGCIPSKALLNSSHKYHEARHDLEKYGIKTGKVSLDLKALLGQKDKVVDDLTKGIDFLFRKNKVERVFGKARLLGQSEGGVDVGVSLADGSEDVWQASRVLIATGSQNASLPGITIDEKRIVSSTGALSLGEVPEKMVVVGGGYIGLELGSVWSRLGAEVTVVEFLHTIVPAMDVDVRVELKKQLEKQGLRFKLGFKVSSVREKKKGLEVTIEPAAGGEAETFDADVVLVSIGRRPFTEGLGLETLGVALDERGFIRVNGQYETSVPGIYAIGDVIPGPMLAHKASEEGVVAVENMAGRKPSVNYGAIPGVVYTSPEAATVGLTEDQLKKDGTPYKAGKFPFLANSRAKAVGQTDGFVKVLADAATDRILGVHIVAQDAGTLIAEAAALMEFGASAEDLGMICHAHPTFSEALKEAALAVHGEAIHF